MENRYKQFIDTVWDYYQEHARDLPWRQVDQDGGIDSYKVLVSEIMLQQTQAGRVIPKYTEFLRVFPDVHTLAAAPLEEVLRQWSGLGYNRRAKFLWEAAKMIISDYRGVVPDDESGLTSLPGVGINTARAVLAYAWNRPVVFIETNVRTVYIHHFFEDSDAVHDKEILSLATDTVDVEHPREWYWALMDYGTFLKKTVGNRSRRSVHYNKQSTFKGSKRQIRGKIIKMLTAGPVQYQAAQAEINDDRFESVVTDLLTEQLIGRSDDMLHL